MENFDTTDTRPALIVVGGGWTHAPKSPGESWSDILAKKYNFQLRKVSEDHTSNQQLFHRLNKVLIRIIPKLRKRGVPIAGVIFEIQNATNVTIATHQENAQLRHGMPYDKRTEQIEKTYNLDVDQYYKDVIMPQYDLIYDQVKYQIAAYDKLLQHEGIPNYWWDALDVYVWPGERILINSMLTELTWNESNCPDSIGDWGRRVMSYVKSERVKFAVDCDLLHRNLEPTAKAHKRIAMVMEYSMKDIFKQPYSYMSVDRMRGSIYGPE